MAGACAKPLGILFAFVLAAYRDQGTGSRSVAVTVVVIDSLIRSKIRLSRYGHRRPRAANVAPVQKYPRPTAV